MLHRLDQERFKFPQYFTPEWEQSSSENIQIGAAIDVETTGLFHERDKVIEMGIRLFKFHKISGEILSLESSYSAFQDPKSPLSEEIKSLTGISNEMLAGQSIDWNLVNDLLQKTQIIVAHNAAFDRPFIDRSTSVSSQKIWGCSLKQIDWKKKGFPSPKLDLLNIYHGFFTESHRALNDADALVHLLSFTDESTKSPYLKEILDNAIKPSIFMVASNSPFESKELLKGRNYRWDGQNKYWSKQIPKEHLPTEISWLEEKVYSGTFRGRYLEIQPTDNFKATS